MAYDTTLHPDAISAASVCLMDLPSTQVILYWQQLQTSAAEHFGAESKRATELISPLENGLLWLHILICVSQQHNALPEMFHGKFLYIRMRISNLQAAEADWTYYAFRSLYDQELGKGVSGQLMVDLKMSHMIELALRGDIPWGAVVFQGDTLAHHAEPQHMLTRSFEKVLPTHIGVSDSDLWTSQRRPMTRSFIGSISGVSPCSCIWPIGSSQDSSPRPITDPTK